MWNIWQYEWKTMTRQRSYYGFLGLWVIVFSLVFLLEGSNPGISGYTNTAATIVNILLYLLPLFMMLIGSFSIATEMENGQWQLLNTYPFGLSSYFSGKFLGLYTAQWIIFTSGFGVSMLIGAIVGVGPSLRWIFEIYLFSLLLMYVFLLIGLFIGTFVATRWKALMVTVIVWFFVIMIWPMALIALLGLLPYPMISLFMKSAMFVNPADFLRVYFISFWGGGAVFGQSYDGIVQLFQSKLSWAILLGYVLLFSILFMTLSIWNLRRRMLQ